jgi:hypothetical protein
LEELQLTSVFLVHPVPQLGWVVERLPMTIRSGALVPFLKRNHSIRHPTGGLETERQKYGSIPGPVWT